jgi:Fic family protein
MFDPDKPYNDLPLLPQKQNLETIRVLRKTVSANKALAELKGLGDTIPNQSMLINLLTLIEAKDSSEIENIITTHDELFRAFSIQSRNIDPSLKEVLNYREAFWAGYNMISEKGLITTNIICKIQELLLNNTTGIRSLPGTKLKNDRTGKTIYTPPEGEMVIREKLGNLEHYINSDAVELDPLIKMAVIHYQFEAIHPYYDGNGRTGRMLNVLYLIYKKLLSLPVLYLSSYIIKNKGAYYNSLIEVTSKNEWENWILFMLEAVEQTSFDAIGRIRNIRSLMERTSDQVKTELPKIYSKELIEVIFQQPYCKISHVVEAGIVARRVASEYLKQLAETGILERRKAGRDVLFINKGLYSLLKN